MQYRIYLSPPHLSGREIKYVQEAFDTNWIAPVGPNIDAFEEDLCKYLGCKYALALSSGTAALHLALLALGIQKGDVVLCQSLTFVATANPIIYIGAIPVFVGSESLTWNMCPNALEDAILYYIRIGKKPKVVIIVHLYGMPAMLKEIMYLCAKYEILLVEDAAEALGSEYKDRKVGTFGDAGFISFNGNKIITTSAGGALLSDNQKVIQRALYLATQAREPVMHYVHQEIGYNYRMSNVCAAIGRGQLEVIQERIQIRREIFDSYSYLLAETPVLYFQIEPEGSLSNRWLTVVRTDPRINVDSIVNHFMNAGIEVRHLWKPVNTQTAYKSTAFFGDASQANIRGLCLPSGSNLTKEELTDVQTCLLSYLDAFK